MFSKNQGLKQFLKSIFKSALSYKILYLTGLILSTIAGLLYGKKTAIAPLNPQIVIDTSEIDCGCENFIKNDEIKDNETELLEDNNPNINTNVSQTNSSAPAFVASKNGTKYYPIDCAGVNRIKEENKVFYQTEEEAQQDDKEMSSTCQ